MKKRYWKLGLTRKEYADLEKDIEIIKDMIENAEAQLKLATTFSKRRELKKAIKKKKADLEILERKLENSKIIVKVKGGKVIG